MSGFCCAQHVKRLAAVVHERLDVVLQDLRVLVLLRVLNRVDPRGGGVGALEAEAAGVEDLVHGDVAVFRLDDHGVLLEAADDGLQLGDLVRVHEVGLVEDERGAELDLLDEQRLDVVLVDVVLEQVLAAVELVVHARAVHDGHDVVQVERGVALVL